MKASQQLSEQFRTALVALAAHLNDRGRAEDLVALGIVTADAVEAVGASLLFADDLPADALRCDRV